MPVRSKQTPTDRLFGALANPTRRDILDMLLQGERSAGEVAARFEMSRPSVSEHLRALRDAGLVTERTDGRSVLYSPAPEPLLAVRDWLAPHERFWRERLKRMRGVLDALPDHTRPDGTLADRTRSDHALPDHAQPDGTLPDGTLADHAQPDHALPDHDPAPPGKDGGS